MTLHSNGIPQQRSQQPAAGPGPGHPAPAGGPVRPAMESGRAGAGVPTGEMAMPPSLPDDDYAARAAAAGRAGDPGPAIGILGGMGPEATVDLFAKIVRATPARVDQDHVRIVIDNNPKIPDRTAYLRGEGPDPVPAMVAAIRGLAALGASLILIPCNTAHVYFDRLQAESPVPILHIMREVARALAAGRIPAPGGATGPGAPAAIPGPGNGVPSPWAETRVAGGAAAMANGLPGAGPELPLPAGGPVGLLATELTVQSGLYHRALAEVGLEVLVPEPEYQALVTRAIFGADGIKAGVYEPARQRLLAAGRHLVERGARVLIAGCTELPLVLRPGDFGVPWVDPAEILARAALARVLAAPAPATRG